MGIASTAITDGTLHFDGDRWVRGKHRNHQAPLTPLAAAPSAAPAYRPETYGVCKHCGRPIDPVKSSSASKSGCCANCYRNYYAKGLKPPRRIKTTELHLYR